jgi:prepilin-type processing-associated H-X9-DG protein
VHVFDKDGSNNVDGAGTTAGWGGNHQEKGGNALYVDGSVVWINGMNGSNVAPAGQTLPAMADLAAY